MDLPLIEDACRARSEIAAGSLRGTEFRERLLRIPEGERDRWLDEVLELETWVEDVALRPGGVPYLPCSVQVILGAISLAALAPEDLFVDLGAGLGRVAVLAHLLTGSPASGIEVQRHLVERGQRCCRELGLNQVRLEHGDASEIPFEGTVFFLYSPFNGATLERVVKRLEALGREQRVTICAVDLELPTLRGFVREPCNDVALSLYRSSGRR